MTDAGTHWQARPEAGGGTGLGFLAWIAEHLDPKILRLLLYPAVAYFYCIRAPERRASRDFLGRVLGRPVRERDVLRHFLRFAQVTADRFYLLANRRDAKTVRFVGADEVQRVVDLGRPGIFLAAHFGSFEAARVIGPQLGGVGLRIVLAKGVNARFIELMARVGPEHVGQIIDSQQSKASLGVAIANAIHSGDWVGFLADRHRPGDPTTQCEFLGEPARFPVGPYIVANALSAPIVCVFCRVTRSGYDVHCETLSEGLRAPRAERAATVDALAQRYAKMLERHVRAAPFGWFNFFDFWARA